MATQTPSKTLTGKGGSVIINGNFIPITEWSCKFAAQYAESTDSSTYDPTTDTLWKKQDQGDIGLEGTIKGHFDLNTTASDLIPLIYQGGGPYPITLALNSSTNLISNTPADLTDGEVTLKVEGATEVDFSLNWKSHGVPTFGNG